MTRSSNCAAHPESGRCQPVAAAAFCVYRDIPASVQQQSPELQSDLGRAGMLSPMASIPTRLAAAEPQAELREPVGFPVILRGVILLLVAGWLLSMVSAAVDHRHPLLQHRLQWLFTPYPGFDLICYRLRFAVLQTPAFFTRPGYQWFYPAPCAFLYAILYRLGALTGSSRACYVFFFLFAIVLGLACALPVAQTLMRRGLTRSSALIIAVLIPALSWPFYFGLQRGNLELLIWPILAGGVAAFARHRFRRAALLIGAAGGFKLYPLLCLGLLFAARRFRELALGLVTTVLLTLAGLRFLEPSILFAARAVRSSVTEWTKVYALSYSPTSTAYDHTAYSLLKLLALPFDPNYQRLEHFYLIVAAGLALALFLLRVRTLPRVNQVVFLVATCIFIPPASFDYTLINLLIPYFWLALIAAKQQREFARTSRALNLALFLVALLLAPETFLMYNDITVQGSFKGLCLLALIILAAAVPLEEIAASRLVAPSPLQTA